MLAILGWLVLVGVAFTSTGFIYIVAIWELYGVKSKWVRALISLVLLTLVLFMWYGVYSACPFSVVPK